MICDNVILDTAKFEVYAAIHLTSADPLTFSSFSFTHKYDVGL